MRPPNAAPDLPGPGLPEKEVAKYTLALAEALIYCHSKGVTHRDVKLENIFIGSDGQIKLADFGLATSKPPPLTTLNGVLQYQAPELLVNDRAYDEKVDVWALGIVLYELLVGDVPFPVVNEDQYATLTKIRFDDPFYPPEVPPDAKLSIEGFLTKEPFKRQDLATVTGSAWILRNVTDSK
jgi:serine/threonine protein kinase